MAEKINSLQKTPESSLGSNGDSGSKRNSGSDSDPGTQKSGTTGTTAELERPIKTEENNKITKGIKKIKSDPEPDLEKPGKHSKKSESTCTLVQLEKQLSLWNGVGVIVGIMIGSGIFVSPGSVVRYTGSVGMSLIVWAFSGIMCMCGAFSYAEMGTMIPKSGGTYAYIMEAFGPIPAFLCLWTNFVIQSPAGRAVGLITFANYLLQPFFPNCPSPPYLAVRLVALVMLALAAYINGIGVRFGSKLQDSLSLTKVIALIVIIVVGLHHLARGHVENYLDPMEGTIYEPSSIATAFYSTLFAYGGWNALNCLMEELKNPYKDLPRAIAISLTIVTIVYLLTNVAYFAVLTPSEVLASSAVAVTFGNRTMGVIAWIISIFVACSTFGNLNGGLFTQSRLVYAGARQGLLPRCMALLHVENHTPVVAIISIVVLPSFMIFIPDVGTILAYSSFAGNSVSIMSISSLLWLRYKEPERNRPIKVWLGFPILYLILSICVSIFPIVKRPLEMSIGLVFFFGGLLVYYLVIHLQNKVIGNAMEKLAHVCRLLFRCMEEEKEE